MHRLSISSAVLLAVAATGCATSNPDAAFKSVAAAVKERSGVEARWPRSAGEASQVRELLKSLLAAPLDADRAARIALIANPDLQAELEELGIGQADLAQANRIANPSLDLSIRSPRGGGSDKLEAALSENILDLFIQPLRRRMGEAVLEETKLRVGNRLLAAATRAKTALYTVQASDQLAARLATLRDVHQAAFELAERQLAAGNIADLDLANQQASYEESRIAVLAASAQARVDREQLSRALGVSDELAGYRVAEGLPAIPAADPEPDGLEALALGRRLDVAASHLAIDIVGKALALKRGTRFFPAGIEVGVVRERDTDRTVLTGPSLRVQIPIFDTGAASVARLEALYRQTQRQAEAVALRAGSEVRSASARLTAARQAAQAYATIVIPLRARILDLTLRNYNMMLKGVYDVLLARQEELATEKAYVASWRDYWLARVELEGAVGGALPVATDPPSVSSQAPGGSR